MDKVIGWLLVASALLSIYLSYFDPSRIFIG
jgi:uncharacterized membrane protein YobD (UPF0266 family)